MNYLSVFAFGIIHSQKEKYGYCIKGGWDTPWVCKLVICARKILFKEWQLGLVLMRHRLWENQGMVLKSDILYNIKCVFRHHLIWHLEHGGS